MKKRKIPKKIHLNKGFVALVDKKDFDFLSKNKWFVMPTKKYTSYAIRQARGTTLSMHREIMKAPKDKQVDHINGNGLDNRRENLRLASRSQNLRNCRMRVTNTSGYRGVSKMGRYWQAQFSVNKKSVHLGEFKTPEEAALAYNEALIKHGLQEFARFNIIKKHKLKE